MDTLLFAINAIMPIILLILLGYFLKQKKFLDEQWFKKGNKMIFRVCLPAMLFINVYNIESFSQINWTAVGYAEIVIVFLFLLGIPLVKWLIPDDKQKGVVVQCIFRSNFGIIGLPLAAALGSTESLGIAAVLSAFSIPTFNIFATIAMTMFLKDKSGKVDVKGMVKKIVTNPLNIGVAVGLVVLAIRSVIPIDTEGQLVFSLKDSLPLVYKTINNVSQICSPLALIILGGLFEFSAIKGMKKPIIIGTAARIFFAPLLGVGAVILLSKYTAFQMESAAYPALLALFGSPMAVSSAVMAQEMDNDGVLAGQLVVWTSFFSIITLFVFILALRTLGYL